MVYLLSIGLTLLVLALMLIVLWRVESRGKEANLESYGESLMVLGIVVLAFWLGSLSAQGLSSQAWDVFKNTAISIFLTGGVLTIRGIVQKKPAQLSIVRGGAVVVALISLAFIIWFIMAPS